MVYVNGQEMLLSTLITGGGGGKAIIDCEVLPTEDINVKSFYRTPDGMYWNDGEWHRIIEDVDIVVPDVNTSNRGAAGLVHMYNASSGLRLDESKRMCIASASQTEINDGVSVNKPIVPATIKYAIQNKSFKGDMSAIPKDEENTPPSALVVKNFVESKEVETYTGDFSDITAATSNNANKPTGAFAVKQYIQKSKPVTFKGNIDIINDNNAAKDDAPSTLAVKNFVENKIFDEDITEKYHNNSSFTGHDVLPTVWSVNKRVNDSSTALRDILFTNITPNLLDFKLAIVRRGEKFYVAPGMIALVLPWENHTSFHSSDGTALMSNMGTTVVFATDKMNTDQAMDDGANGYRLALIYITGKSILSGNPIASNHNYYSFDNDGNGCYFQNDDDGTSGTGWTYIYYLSRN